MKAYLINMQLLVPRSRSSAKFKVKYKGYISKKLRFRGHSCFTNTSCFFSSTGRRPASYCHGVVSVVCPSVSPSVRACLGVCVRKLFLQKTSPHKPLTGFLPNFTGMFLRWSSFKFLQIIVFYEEFWLPWRSK